MGRGREEALCCDPIAECWRWVNGEGSVVLGSRTALRLSFPSGVAESGSWGGLRGGLRGGWGGGPVLVLGMHSSKAQNAEMEPWGHPGMPAASQTNGATESSGLKALTAVSHKLG